MKQEVSRMILDQCTLGELLSRQEIRPVAQDAIRGRALWEEPVWNMSLKRLREERVFSGDIGAGLNRLLRAAATGDWYYPLYSEDECRKVEARRGVSLVWCPSDDPRADGRPFILVVPGGGFVNVWNLTEGWPIADRFTRLGYHAFVLTYQVDAEEKLLFSNMEDIARGLLLIREKQARFHVSGDNYITCGFSAGGYLVCLWNTSLGYRAFGLNRPRACFPVYPVVSLREDVRYGETGPEWDRRLFGCSAAQAIRRDFEIPDHAEGFPPCSICLAGDDGLVNPENSRILYRALTELHIPCRLETGPAGGHGFADGTDTSLAGWPERAVSWYEGL